MAGFSLPWGLIDAEDELSLRLGSSYKRLFEASVAMADFLPLCGAC